MPHPRKLLAHVLVCAHKDCRKDGGDAVAKELKHAIRDENLRSRVMLTETDCLDRCGHGPIVVVYPEGVWYGEVDKTCARAIIKEHIAGGGAIESRVLCRTGSEDGG